MSFVQIDDYNCSNCGKTTTANLDIRRAEYTCMECGK
jgi:DNA-directed RNA polymerase subunit RPC12/RpoP